MSIGLGQMLISGLIGSQIGKSGGLMQMLGNKNNQEMPEEATHTMPDGTVMPGATHNQYAQAPQQGGGFMQGISNMMGNPSQEQIARIGLGLNSMRMHPDDNLAASFRETIKTAQGKKNLNATVEQLIKMGKPNIAELVRTGAMPMGTAMTLAFDKGATDAQGMISFMATKVKDNPHFADYMEILKVNPGMLDDISKSVQKDLGLTPDSNFTIKSSAPSVMQNGEMKGHEYVVVTDPNKTGEDRVYIEYTGAILPTMDEEIKMKAAAEALVADKALARQVGFDAFNEAQGIESQIGMLNQALDQVITVDDNGVTQFRDDGARTGIIEKYLASTRSTTSTFNTILNKLGISVINMATFGALSEREMAMAMRTNLDPNLDGQELVDFIRESIDAKKKLATVLYERSLALNKGSGSYQEWQDETASKMVTHNKHRYEKLNKSQIKGLQAIIDNPKNGYSPNMTTRDLWSRYNLDTRIAAMKGN
jgi:hypothetical protein